MKVILIILAVIAGIVAVVAMLFYLVKFILQLLGVVILPDGWGKYIMLFLMGKCFMSYRLAYCGFA